MAPSQAPQTSLLRNTQAMQLPRPLVKVIDPATAYMQARSPRPSGPVFRGGAIFGPGVPGGARQATFQELEEMRAHTEAARYEDAMHERPSVDPAVTSAAARQLIDRGRTTLRSGDRDRPRRHFLARRVGPPDRCRRTWDRVVLDVQGQSEAHRRTPADPDQLPHRRSPDELERAGQGMSTLAAWRTASLVRLCRCARIRPSRPTSTPTSHGVSARPPQTGSRTRCVALRLHFLQHPCSTSPKAPRLVNQWERKGPALRRILAGQRHNDGLT